MFVHANQCGLQATTSCARRLSTHLKKDAWSGEDDEGEEKANSSEGIDCNRLARANHAVVKPPDSTQGEGQKGP